MGQPSCAVVIIFRQILDRGHNLGKVQVGPLLISDIHENVVGVDEVNLSVILLFLLRRSSDA